MSDSPTEPNKENQFHTIESIKVAFETISQGIVIYDDQLQLVAWNKHYETIGISPVENIRYGANLLELYTEFAKAGVFGVGDHQQLAQRRIQSIGDCANIQVELMNIPSNGHTIRIQQYHLPNDGICVTFEDVTDEMKMENQLRQTQKMDAVGKLTGGVAHDINNVLAVVTGNLELALDKVEDESLEALIRSALNASDRGAKLTHRLLAFARQQPLNPEIVHLRSLLLDMVEMLRKMLGEDIDVELVTDAGVWLCEADRHQLESVIVNLAVNSRDAMPNGGKITVDANNARIDSDYAELAEIPRGQYVCVSVSDNGCGIEPDFIDRVFEPFFTTKAAGHGTGLGLSMAHGFVKQSGGHIKVYSEVGEGTTIKIYLPRVEEESAVSEENSPQPFESSDGTETIMVVEDDDHLREVIVGQLESMGYSVFYAANGPDALKILERDIVIDLLLTDVVLPGGMSGRDLSNVATRLRTDLPVIFMSGYTENAIIHNGRLDRDVVLLQKPFRKSELAHTIREALDTEN